MVRFFQWLFLTVSDPVCPAIHMAFDCMAIGVGLFASVMATWEPNERFTYG
jgi:zinc transporter 5/7